MDNAHRVKVFAFGVVSIGQLWFGGPVEAMSPSDRFAAEAQKAWESTAKLNENVLVRVDIRSTNRVPGKEWNTNRTLTIKSRAPMLLVERLNAAVDGKPPSAAVYAVSSHRSFVLHRGDESAWSVSFVGPVDHSGTADHVELDGRTFINWPWQLGDYSLPQLYKSDRFSVVKFEDVPGTEQTEPSRTFLKIFFEYHPIDKDVIRLREGWAILDPEMYWSIRQCEFRTVSPNGQSMVNKGSTEYLSEDAVPRVAHFSSENDNPSESATQEIEFLKYERVLIPEAEFELQSYGIDMKFEQGGRWRSLVILNIGIIAIIVAIVLYRRMRAAGAAN